MRRILSDFNIRVLRRMLKLMARISRRTRLSLRSVEAAGALCPSAQTPEPKLRVLSIRGHQLSVRGVGRQPVRYHILGADGG